MKMTSVNVESVDVPVPRNLLSDFESTLDWQEINHPQPTTHTTPTPPTPTQTPRRGITCSFCKCIGHNIRHCNSNSQAYLHEQIKWYLTVSDDSNYARLSNEEFARIVEMHLYTSNVANLSMFCVILNIPIEKRKADLVAAVKERITSVRFARKFMYDQQVAERRMREIKKQMQEDIEELLRKKEHILQVERTASESGNRVHELLANGMNETFRNQTVDFYNKYDFVSYANLMGQIAELETEYRKTIEVVNVFTHEDAPKEECPVCYDMIPNDKICVTQCSHTFCYDCLTKVIQTNEKHNCPYCREKIVGIIHPVCDETCAELKGIYCIGF
jgi:hypothetical protein